MTWQGQFHVDKTETFPEDSGQVVVYASVTEADRMGVGDSAYPALTTNTEGEISKIEILFHCKSDPGLSPGDRLAIGGHFTADTSPTDVLGQGGQDFEPPAVSVPTTDSAPAEVPVATNPPVATGTDDPGAAQPPAPADVTATPPVAEDVVAAAAPSTPVEADDTAAAPASDPAWPADPASGPPAV